MTRRIGYTVRKVPSGRWQLQVRGEDGVRVAMGTYATEKAADEAGQAEAVKVRGGLWTDPRRSDILLSEYMESWLERRARTGRHGRTYQLDAQRLHRLHIAPTLGKVWMSDLRPGHVNRWYEELVADRIATSGTVGLIPAKAYRLVHAALEDAVRDQILVRNPCDIVGGGVERSPERKFLDPEQVIALAEAVHPRWKAMVILAGFMGLRIGELAGLRRRSIDLLHGRLTVDQVVVEMSNGELTEKAPKTAAGHRTITIPASLLPVIEEHLAQHVGADPDARVFTSAKGQVLRRTGFGKEWRQAVRAVDLSGVTFHDLRHAAGTLAAQLGATERELQARLGHASPVAARRYQHAAEARERELADRIGTAFTAASSPGGRVVDFSARSAHGGAEP